MLICPICDSTLVNRICPICKKVVKNPWFWMTGFLSTVLILFRMISATIMKRDERPPY